MKSKFILLALQLLTASLFAQYFVVGEDLRSYDAGINQAQQFVESELEKGYDFTYPASERIITELTPLAGSGNIGYNFHGVDKVEGIIENSKGKVAFIPIDDCAGFSHSAIRWIESLARDFTGEDPNLRDQGRHSHHVTGIAIANVPGTNIGICGQLAADDRAVAVPVKALTFAGSGFYSWIAAAGNYAADIIPTLHEMGYDQVIVIMSLGGNSSSSAVDNALKRIRDAGGIIYAANGNTGREPVQYPGRSIHTEGVAALTINSDGTASRAGYSSRGPETTLAAVGTNVRSCQPNNEFANFDGTSMAAPMAAGVAGLAAAVDLTLTGEMLLQRVRAGCTDMAPAGKDNLTGLGYPYAPDVLQDKDDPNDPNDPNDPDRPDFESSLVYEIDDMKLKYRRASSTRFYEIKMNDMLVSVAGNGTTEDVYDDNQEWTESWFNRVNMIIPDDPTWGHCLTTYWTGQFYEYWSRNDAIGAQVQVARGEDHKGRNCFQFEFNRASSTEIRTYVTPKKAVVLSASTPDGVVQAVIRPPRKGVWKFLFGE